MISKLRKLEILDDTKVTKEERSEAERIYGHQPSFKTTFVSDSSVVSATKHYLPCNY